MQSDRNTMTPRHERTLQAVADFLRGPGRRRRVGRPKWGRGGDAVPVGAVLPGIMAELDEGRRVAVVGEDTRAAETPTRFQYRPAGGETSRKGSGPGLVAVEDGLQGHGDGHVEALQVPVVVTVEGIVERPVEDAVEVQEAGGAEVTET